MGLFLGATFLTVSEFFELALVIICGKCNTGRRKNSQIAANNVTVRL